MSKEIPTAVLNEALSLISHYGQHIEFLGEFCGAEYYTFRFPENSLTGFPYVYIYDLQTEDVLEITGLNALDIISKFR